MKTQEQDYLKGLQAGFKAEPQEEVKSDQPIFYRFGFYEGQKASTEFKSTEMILNQFLDKD
ncbi:MAG: hypothetical protein GKR88_02150 [Flavobacteriaceae bacterium]|nr:MAG: hypothetical protein GKR88_02150 [Flavobacteriaceae bacterium]